MKEQKNRRLTLKEILKQPHAKVDQKPRTPLEVAKTTLTNQQNNEHVERMCRFNKENSGAKKEFSDSIKQGDEWDKIEPVYTKYMDRIRPFKLSLKKDLDEMRKRHRQEAKDLERIYRRTRQIVFPEWVNARLWKEGEEVKKAVELSKLPKANEEKEGN